jgi:hypothetical protein
MLGDETTLVVNTPWMPYGAGDLVDAARRAADLIGSSAEISALAVMPPPEGSDMPTVQVVIDDPDLFEGIRQRLTEQEMLPHFVHSAYAGSWAVEMDNVLLRVVCTEAGEK